MRQLARPRTLVLRRLKALERQLPLAITGEARGIHQARVASRRLREVLPVLASFPGEPRVGRLGREIRSLTRVLGPVRELDVALQSLAEVARGVPGHRNALDAVRARLEDDRREAFPQMDRVRDLDFGRLADRVLSLAPDRPSPAAVRRCAARIATRIGARSVALRQAVDACGTLFSMDQLHGARIALKKFRYTLEVGEQMGRFRLKATMRRLKALQDRLGHMHDLYVLAARIRDDACGDSAHREALEEVATGIDEEIRRLHGAFLAERHRLGPVLVTAGRVRAQLGVLAVRLWPVPAVRVDGTLRREAG